MKERKRLLIVGAPRSGTTVISSVIGHHTHIGIINEDVTGRVERIIGKSIIGNKLCIPHQIEIENRKNIIAVKLKMVMKNITPLKIIFKWMQKNVFFINFVVGTRGKYSIKDYLDKNFYVVGIIRNKMECIDSQIRHGNAPPSFAYYRWKRTIEILNELYEKEQDKILIISYEKFLENPTSEMRRFCYYIGLEFKASMIDGAGMNSTYNISGIKKPSKQIKNETKINEAIKKRYKEDYEIDNLYLKLLNAADK